jgi:uncharacterized protein involved in exopolysaccharide biosynthesis
VNERKEHGAAERPSLLDYLIVIFKWKSVIAGTILSSVAIGALCVLLLPPVYLGETRILAPNLDTANISAQLLGQQVGASGGMSLLGSVGRNSNDLYVGLMQSSSILDRIVERFGLVEAYRVKFRKEARDRLARSMRFNNDKKSGLLVIGVEDRDPKRAADMANTLVEELLLITRRVAITEASQRRMFYENRLKESKAELLSAEEALKRFQGKTGAFEMREQTKALVEAGARLRAQIASKEVDRKVLKTYAMPQNPDLQRIEDELKGLREQLGRTEARNGSNDENLVTTGNVIEAGTGYVRMVRELKYHEALYELLSKQYELARIDETRLNAPIQVIDRAMAPEKRERPKRARTVAASALFGVFSGLLLAFVMENRERMAADPLLRTKLDTLRRYATMTRRRA